MKKKVYRTCSRKYDDQHVILAGNRIVSRSWQQRGAKPVFCCLLFLFLRLFLLFYTIFFYVGQVELVSHAGHRRHTVIEIKTQRKDRDVCTALESKVRSRLQRFFAREMKVWWTDFCSCIKQSVIEASQMKFRGARGNDSNNRIRVNRSINREFGCLRNFVCVLNLFDNLCLVDFLVEIETRF